MCIAPDLLTPCYFPILSAEPQREELEANIKGNLITTARSRGTNYPTFDANQVSAVRCNSHSA